jgi:membrane-associated phospholipid phosphatase
MELDIIRAIQKISSPFLDGFFQAVTMLGEQVFFTAVFATVYWCIDKKKGFRLGMAVVFASLVNTLIKNALRIPRPIGQPGIRSLRVRTATGYSFPSGHSQSAATLFTFLARWFHKAWAYALGAFLVLLVGFSRMYLGLHTVFDILGGFAVGVAFVYIADWFVEWIEKNEKQVWTLLFLIPILAGAFLERDVDFLKGGGVAAGFIAGYVLDCKKIRYSCTGGFTRQVLKLAAGLAILLLLHILVEPLLSGFPWGIFLCYFIMGIWIMAGAPYLFQKLFKCAKRI